VCVCVCVGVVCGVCVGVVCGVYVCGVWCVCVCVCVCVWPWCNSERLRILKMHTADSN